jgi:hypothetical protein
MVFVTSEVSAKITQFPRNDQQKCTELADYFNEQAKQGKVFAGVIPIQLGSLKQVLYVFNETSETASFKVYNDLALGTKAFPGSLQYAEKDYAKGFSEKGEFVASFELPVQASIKRFFVFKEPKTVKKRKTKTTEPRKETLNSDSE